MAKTHWKTYFNYDYLGAYSLEDGNDLIVTIKSLTTEEVTSSGGRKEDCAVMRFSDSDKPLILNRTNAKTIEKIYGTGYAEDWVGKKIQLYVQSGIRFGKETVDGLRIREFIPKGGKAIDTTEAKQALEGASDLEHLKEIWEGLDSQVKALDDVKAVKDATKFALSE